jgi:hypothetical protein
VNKKNQQSKSQFGTLTAKSDANNDYSQAQSSTMSDTTTASSLSEYGTLTAKFDANNDYGGKSGNQNKGGQNQNNNNKTQSPNKNTSH